MENLFIIDAYNLIYRMFYAIPEITTSGGKPVNAVYGVAKFLKLLWEKGEAHRLIIAMDGPGDNVRNALYAEYKGTRERMPDMLRSQLSDVARLFEILEIPILSCDTYEADDVIGSIVTSIREGRSHSLENLQVIIVSSDKDLCQFVDDGRVHIFDAMKQKFMRRADVIEKFAVPPEQVVDYLAIVGDSSDNIPGIAGFGPKKAESLLGKYQSLEGIYEHLEEIPEKLRAVLIDQKDNAFLSQSLATIYTNLEISPDAEKSLYGSREFWTPGVIEFFQELEFKSLLPTNFRVEKKVLESQKAELIDTQESLTKLMHSMEREGEVILATDKDAICLGLADKIYRIDPKVVDVVPLIDFIRMEGIRVVGYDVKEDLKTLYRYKKSPQNEEKIGQLGMF